MGRVHVDGVGIEYEVTGAGRPVVLLAPDQVNALLLDFLPR